MWNKSSEPVKRSQDSQAKPSIRQQRLNTWNQPEIKQTKKKTKKHWLFWPDWRFSLLSSIWSATELMMCPESILQPLAWDGDGAAAPHSQTVCVCVCVCGWLMTNNNNIMYYHLNRERKWLQAVARWGRAQTQSVMGAASCHTPLRNCGYKV